MFAWTQVSGRVAGIMVPAFVERSENVDRVQLACLTGVAGIMVPAFVERGEACEGSADVGECRRDYGPGLR